ncbi:MAG TPA: cob(I)yrinic acid a,c-diamide adenosyltransferase [Acidobacteriota bacterium]|jgi:cob(I)alamin adenosyltransferase|nr:cob(I)yrinic acid a,c-diamide adenosyltransferase [Acidobacteriota bacterium]|tara:strand:- start:575 stop:1138 length:564 start_codon:yes stop_codon:yes gene_type:complete
MARLTKLYTRTGDGGLTRLGAGTEVAKDALRVRAYGTVDELNSCIGMAIAVGLCERLSVELTAIQNQLFDLGGDLATPESENPEFDVPRIGTEQVNKLEVLIDELTEVVGPLENFILPGGSPGAAALHVARTVCRRAERRVVSLAREENVGADMVPYLNRLSDALFVMARFENRKAGVEEPLWQPGH